MPAKGRRVITKKAPSGMRMPVQVSPPYDLGDLATREDANPGDDELYGKWRGWTVTYRINAATSAAHEFASADWDRSFAALSSVIVGWNFVDTEGKPLPQPTRDNLFRLGLPDELLIAMMLGFMQVLHVPKAT